MGLIDYYIDDFYFREYGIFVESAKGLLSIPDRKDMITHSYDDVNGINVDVAKTYVKERKIVLKCFCAGKNINTSISRINNFFNMIQAKDMMLLKVYFGQSSNPIIYNVYYLPKTDVDVKYYSSRMVTSFDLTFVEPIPVKAIYNVTTPRDGFDGTLSIILSATGKRLQINWGDGDVYDEIINGVVNLTHDYSYSTKPYYMIINGELGKIKHYISNDYIQGRINASLVWRIMW